MSWRESSRDADRPTRRPASTTISDWVFNSPRSAKQSSTTRKPKEWAERFPRIGFWKPCTRNKTIRRIRLEAWLLDHSNLAEKSLIIERLDHARIEEIVRIGFFGLGILA